jgi:hypothetical protein
MCLLLKICDDSSAEYNTEDLAAVIDMALSFEMEDFVNGILACDGWSAKTLTQNCVFILPGDLSRATHIE